jgi:hypothetical protein
MKGQLNPELKVGDRVICYHMDGETSVSPGTLGTVKNISRDPFESEDEKLIGVEWDNGSTLALVTATDAWKLVPQESIKESDISGNPNWKFVTQNPDVFQHFDWRWFRQYLKIIRESGIINMYAASPLLYMGEESIDRYYGEGREDEEEFQAVLNDAEESKNKIIQGVMSYMRSKGKDLDDMSEFNRMARNFSEKILSMYIAMANVTGNL